MNEKLIEMALINLHAFSAECEKRMTQSLDNLTNNLTVLGAKLDSFITSESAKLAQVTIERDALQVKLDALASVDSPEAVQAVSDTVTTLIGKIPG